MRLVDGATTAVRRAYRGGEERENITLQCFLTRPSKETVLRKKKNGTKPEPPPPVRSPTADPVGSATPEG